MSMRSRLQKFLGRSPDPSRPLIQPTPSFTSKTAACRVCKDTKTFPAPLDLAGELRGVDVLARILVYELPTNRETGAAWSHCGILHPLLSQQAGKPTWLWESMCATCAPVSTLAEIERDQAFALAEQTNPALLARLDLSRCSGCSTRREGVKITLRGGFGDVKDNTEATPRPPLGVIELYELDRQRDLSPLSLPARRWCFRGVLDLQKGYLARVFRWGALCPECVARQRPVGKEARVQAIH